jgi:hypothetical protein
LVLRLSVWVYVFFYVVALLVEVRLAGGRGLGPFAWWFCSFIWVIAGWMPIFGTSQAV